MQGRDPDHDEGAPGQGPPPDRERRATDHDDHGGFPVPDDPYGRPGGEDERPAKRPAWEEPGSNEAATEAFQQVSRRQPRGEPEAPPASHAPGSQGGTQRDEQGGNHGRPAEQPAQPHNADAATEAFGAVSGESARSQPSEQPPPAGSGEQEPSQQEPPEQEPPERGPHTQGGSGEAPTTGLPWTGPPSDSLRLAIGDPASRPFPSAGREQEPPPQPPYHQGPSQGSYGSGAPPHSWEGRGTPAAMSAQSGAGHSYPGQSFDFSDLYAKPRHPRRGLFIASLVVVAVLVVGGGAFAYASFVRGGADAGGAPIAGSSTASDGAGRSAGGRSESPTQRPSPSFDPARIRSARADAKPLGLAEEFPDKAITVDGRTFHRVATDMTKECGQTGRKRFAETLRKAGCQRVLRATFVDSREKYAVTVGAAVLPTKADAERVDQAANASRNVWFAALPGPKSSGAAKIHRSGGYSAIEVIGHYAVFSFAAYADKVTPPPHATNLSELCARMRDYAAEPIVARGTVTPSPAAG